MISVDVMRTKLSVVTDCCTDTDRHIQAQVSDAAISQI